MALRLIDFTANLKRKIRSRKELNIANCVVKMVNVLSVQIPIPDLNRNSVIVEQ